MKDSNIMNDFIKRKDVKALIKRFKGYIDVDMIYSICNIKIHTISTAKADCDAKIDEDKDHE